MEVYRRVFSFYSGSLTCVVIFAVCMQYTFCDKDDIGMDKGPDSNDVENLNFKPNLPPVQGAVNPVFDIHDKVQKEAINIHKMQKEELKNVPQMGGKHEGDNKINRPNVGEPIQEHRLVNIADSLECSADVTHYCAKAIHSNNFAILDCLQEDIRDDGVGVSEKCQHFLWGYKRELTKDARFFSAAQEVCKTDLRQMPDCKEHTSGDGYLISCIIEHQDQVNDKACRQFLKKMTAVVFSDWLITSQFIEGCTGEIEKFQCGRIETQPQDEHSQMSVLMCLEDHVAEITDEVCHKQILRIAELQADDYHLDRPLFYACHDVREILCENVKAGEGRVYDCLFKHKFDDKMTEKCRLQLVARQQVIGQDVEADKSFYEACKNDIEKHHCKKNAKHKTETETESDFTKMSTILLCLENVLKRDEDLEARCVAEMNEWRRSLMEDYKINPELVSRCETEINQHCKDTDLEGEGQVIQCLLDLVTGGIGHNKRKNAVVVTDECQRELENLLKAADVGENYRMDPALERACENTVQELCSDITPGDARVLGCLMERIDADAMTPECEDRLLEIQYFVARDFRLDHSLYKSCKADSVKFCHGQNSWADNNEEVQQAEVGPLMLPCLYRNRDKLERSCEHEVIRVMHLRAHSVQLIPGVEEA